ncbi:MAG: DUF4251 domain-containing protein [Prevotellaceae bacterium]|nr:DUF4251 domain-containing protein [Prevotellaceae bacterium]
MRNLFVLFVSVFVLTSCATVDSSEKAERRREKAETVNKAIERRRYVIDVSMAHPLKGRSVTLTSDYELEVINDSVISYLPYFGRAYSIPYGGGKGLNFTAHISEYLSEKKKNGTQISFKAKNDEDTYTFNIEVFESGTAIINVFSQQRDRISFDGELSGQAE